ncbi:DUF5977 domain-containing protein [uncultured Fibrella sp.]|uniref:DUF5977 domain-containing protein n=1 Tax=uncultured Fibrella sp. TaxID=1284596 RepID=UPI0035CA411C
MIDALAQNLVFQPLAFSRNRLEVLIDPADTALTDRSNLRYALTLLVPNYPQSTTFEELTTLSGRERPPVISAGAMRYDGAQFRIDELLDGFLQVQKPFPRQAVLGIVPSLTMPYCLHERVTGGTPAVSTDVTRPKMWVFAGGLDRADFAGWGTNFFNTYLAAKRQFLTWQPADKVVSGDVLAEEYLYFLINFTPTPTQIRLKAQLTWPDGRQETCQLLALDSPVLNSVVSVPAGVAQLGLVGEGITSYQLWLSNQNDERLSEVRTYRIDPEYRPDQRWVLFANSLGGFDTVRLLGQGSETMTANWAITEQDQFGSTAIDFASMRVVNVDADNTLTVSTGYFEEKGSYWLQYLTELMLTRAVYQITEKGHIPLLLTTAELTNKQDNSDVIARTLTFKRANQENNYSQLPVATSGPVRPTAWRGEGAVILLRPDGKRSGAGRPLKLQKYYVDDSSLFKPVTEKPNLPGDPDYIPEIMIPGIAAGSTPYPSTAIIREGTFFRDNCPTGQTGQNAAISIAAGAFGGENPGDADVLAEAEFTRLNNQVYANIYGGCSLNPYDYPATVGAGNWRFRTNAPGRIVLRNDTAGLGNAWFAVNGANLFPLTANDRDVPVTSSPGDWTIGITTAGSGGVSTVKTYRNGVLVASRRLAWNAGPFRLLDAGVAVVAAGDRIFIEEILD